MRRSLLYSIVLMVTVGMAIPSFAAGGRTEKSSQGGSSRQQEQTQRELAAKTIEGEVLEVQEKEYYVIRDSNGKKVRLDVQQGTLVDETIAKGDRVEAKVAENGRAVAIRKASRREGEQTQAMKGDEPRRERTAQAEGEMKGQERKGSRARGEEQERSQKSAQSAKKTSDFTKTIKGEVLRIQENLYYVQDDEGKEVRLRIDQSVKKQGDIQKGDTVEVMVSKEKEYHVISIKPAKKSQSKQSQ